MMDDNAPSQIWFLAPQSVKELDVCCLLCHLPIRPGQVVMDDGEDFLHESCYEEEVSDGHES